MNDCCLQRQEPDPGLNITPVWVKIDLLVKQMPYLEWAFVENADFPGHIKTYMSGCAGNVPSIHPSSNAYFLPWVIALSIINTIGGMYLVRNMQTAETTLGV